MFLGVLQLYASDLEPGLLKIGDVKHMLIN